MRYMQLQYAAAPQPTHQYYGGCGYYGEHNNFCSQVGHGAQRRGNWRGFHGGRGSSDLTRYCWTHGICDHPGTDWRIPVEGHKMNAVCFNKMLGNESNWTWQVGLIPVINHNAVENKTSYTSELLCSSTVDPPQHATIISKADSDTSNNYCRNKYQIGLIDIKDTHNEPTFQLPNNATMIATKTGDIPLSRSLRLHAKKEHILCTAKCFTYLLRTNVWIWLHLHI